MKFKVLPRRAQTAPLCPTLLILARPAPHCPTLSSCLQALRALELPVELETDKAVADVMRLLKLLEAVNRLGTRLCAVAEAEEAAGAVAQGHRVVARDGCTHVALPGEFTAGAAPVYGRMPREEFVCSKLSSKLGQQLKDVLAICGGGLPGWCKQLVQSSRCVQGFVRGICQASHPTLWFPHSEPGFSMREKPCLLRYPCSFSICLL